MFLSIEKQVSSTFRAHIQARYGIDLSNQYIVNNNLSPVMSVSFGACEAAIGSANGFYNSLWQQAAAQGISVFISSGDSGSGFSIPAWASGERQIGIFRDAALVLRAKTIRIESFRIGILGQRNRREAKAGCPPFRPLVKC